MSHILMILVGFVQNERHMDISLVISVEGVCERVFVVVKEAEELERECAESRSSSVVVNSSG